MNTLLTTKKQKTLRVLFFFIGIIILSLGISLTIVSNFGAGAWDTLNVTLSNTFGYSIGTWVIIVGIILLLVSSILERRSPRVTSLLTSFVIGICIDIWMLPLDTFVPKSQLSELIVYTAGILVTTLGLSFIIFVKFPPGPIDYFALAIRSRFCLSIGQAKTIGEIIGLLLVILFKGPIGIGTLLTTVIIGPFIKLSNKLTHPMLSKIIRA